MTARITGVHDLSPTAREVTLALVKPLGFTPGAFVNVFMSHEGVRMRRAYSISSDEDRQDTITLSIRKGSPGGMSERFWDAGIVGTPLEIMGPLGLHTADKITSNRVFLFGFGIGVSVLKGLLPHLLRRKDVTDIVLLTGSRNEAEILYKDFFENAVIDDSRLTVRFVCSQPSSAQYPFKGYLQDNLDNLDFADSSVYICGSKKAAESLKESIEDTSSTPREYLLEVFD